LSGSQPRKGDVWRVELDPVRGHEQGRTRPCVVVSEDWFNTASRGMVVVIPLTSRVRGIPLQVVVQPPEGGLQVASAVKIEDIRSVAIERFSSRYGRLAEPTLVEIAERLRILLGL
jgi:mRNA interferase MazF